MDYIVYAIPVFFVMIALEVLATVVRGKDYYRLNDAINSLSTGMLSITTGITTKLITAAIYTGIYSLVALFEMDSSSLWVWVFGFVFYDFCYYWLHRKGHEINILWAAHAVHHQSEEYNLTTALRQTSTGFLLGWIFYVPMALAGVPPVVFFTVGLLNLLYQYWVHSRHIPKLGFMENYFVTASNHRVHHAKNRRYLDKNYGGVFIIWDRIFGTFCEEDEKYEPIRYGTLKPLRSWNPVWANFHLYHDMWLDAKATSSWQEKLTLWFKRTGYRPADVAAPMKMPDIHGYENYNPETSRGLKVYAGLQFFILIIATTALLGVSHIMPMGFSILGTLTLAWNLTVLGWLLETRSSLIKLELARFALTVGACLAGFWLFAAPLWLLQISLVFGLVSVMVLSLGKIGTKADEQVIQPQ